jgi:hypothetical protein
VVLPPSASAESSKTVFIMFGFIFFPAFEIFKIKNINETGEVGWNEQNQSLLPSDTD